MAAPSWMAITARASPSALRRDAGRSAAIDRGGQRGGERVAKLVAMGDERGGDVGTAGGVEPKVGAHEHPVAIDRERPDDLGDELGQVGGWVCQAGGDAVGDQFAALRVEGEEQLLERVEV